jgi:hypothetical protein
MFKKKGGGSCPQVPVLEIKLRDRGDEIGFLYT